MRAQVQLAVPDRQDMAGTDDVDMIRLDRHAILDLVHRHRGMPGEDLGHHAFAVRREVLDQDERHAAVRPHGVEKLGESFQAARGGADADDREGQTRLLEIHWLNRLIMLSFWRFLHLGFAGPGEAAQPAARK